jgi:hypothetical protein
MLVESKEDKDQMIEEKILRPLQTLNAFFMSRLRLERHKERCAMVAIFLSLKESKAGTFLVRFWAGFFEISTSRLFSS